MSHVRRHTLSPTPLDGEGIERVHLQAMRLLEEVGIEVHDEEMLRLLGKHGQQCEGSRVFFDRDFVMEQLGLAPSTFELTGRNPKRAVTLGAGNLVHTPVAGPPFVFDRERGRRDGTLEAHNELLKLAHSSDSLAMMQSGTVEPVDLDYLSRHLQMDYAALRLSDRPVVLTGTSGEKMRDGLALAAIIAGGEEALIERPMTIGIVNPNSPLMWDQLMVSTLVACAEYGQPVAITPFLLAGASAPVSLASGLSLLVAETLAGIAMAQITRPGAPCIFGCFFSGVDMRSGGPSLGLPESVLTTLAGAQLAEHYGIPLRGGGALCSGIPLDAQTSAESTMSLWATYLAGCDLVVHAAGWIEGGLTASFEKFVFDLELIKMMNRLDQGLLINEEELAFDTIAEVGPGGLFMAHEHTLNRFRTDLFMSPLFRSQAFQNWSKQGSPTADEIATSQWRQLLESYDDPGIDDSIDAELQAYIERRSRELEA